MSLLYIYIYIVYIHIVLSHRFDLVNLFKRNPPKEVTIDIYIYICVMCVIVFVRVFFLGEFAIVSPFVVDTTPDTATTHTHRECIKSLRSTTETTTLPQTHIKNSHLYHSVYHKKKLCHPHIAMPFSSGRGPS